MADEVKIPINLEVTDLDISKVNPRELERGMQKNLDGVRRAFEGIMKTLDTTHVSKEFSKAATSINSSFRSAESAVKGLSKSINDLDKGTTTIKGVEKSAEDVVTAFKKITEEYSGFSASANTEMALTPQFRNGLSVVQDMMREMKAYTSWTEKAATDSNTTSEYWEQLEIYTKSAKANIQSMLADLREMVKSGEAFKLGKDDEASSEYMRMLKSIQGTTQAGFNRANFLFGGAGTSASADLIAARTEVDRLSHSLELARMNLETMMRGESTTNPQIEAMQAEVHNLTEQLAEAEANFRNLYDEAYGITEEIQQAANATVELEAASEGVSSGLQVSDAAVLMLSENLNTIIELLGELTIRGEDAGESVGEGFNTAGEKIDKTNHKSKALNETFQATRNVTTAMIMTLQQLGSVGTIIAQVIGIVQLLADAFRDVSTAAHSIIPIIGLFVGLAINVIGRLISILKKVLALLKQIALAVLDVAKKIGGTLVSGIKKLAGLFKSMIPSMTTIRKLLRKITQYFLGFRSAYFLIRKVRQAVIDGMKDIAANAPEVNEYMSNFSTALNQLKGSLTGAFEPIMSVVIPALTRLMQVLAQVLTYIAKFNAVLVGRDYYYDYAAAMQDYAGGISGVGKAAKKAQKDLMGFDEINRLSAPNDPSGGGGSGLGGTFTRSEIDMQDAISEFAKMVREAWENSDFTEVGKKIGEKFNDVLTSFNSNTVQTKIRNTAEKVARSFATLINGFVETEDLGLNLGKSIANLFNTAFNFLYRFSVTVHWDSVGKFIGDGIAGALTTFDWSKMFVTIANFVNGLADMIINAVAGHNWWEIGGKIANGLIDGLKKFDAAKAGKAVHDFFKALLDFINGFIAQMSKKQLVSTPDNSVDGFMYEYKTGWELIADKIKEFIENLDLEDVGASTGEATSGMLNGFFKILTGADFGDGVKAFVDGFMDGLQKYPWQSSMHDFWDVYYPKLKSFLVWAAPQLVDIIKAMWEVAKGPVLEIATEIGEALGEAIWDGMKKNLAKWFGVGDFAEDAIEEAKKDYAYYGVDLEKAGSKTKANKAVNRHTKDFEWMMSLSEAKRTQIEQSKNFQKLPEEVKEAYFRAKESAEGYKKAIKDTTTSVTNDTATMETSASSFAKGTQQASDTASTSFVKTSNGASEMASAVTGSFNETTMAMQSSMDAVTPMANKAYSGITSTFNQVPAYFSDTFGQAWNEVQKSMMPDGALTQGLALGINKVVNVSVNRMVDAINSVAITPLQRLSDMMDKLRGVTIGGLSPFAGLPKLNFYKIPKLAQGAVLPPNQPFLSIVGDQKRGTNVEAPLEVIQQAVADVMGDNTEAILAMGEAIVRAIQNKDLSVRIGDRDIGQANDRYNQRLATMRGV